MASKKRLFPNVYPLHIREYDNSLTSRMTAGETETYAVEYSSQSKVNRNEFNPPFARFLTLFSHGLVSRTIEDLRRFARNNNRDDAQDMYIWKRKVTYGEWELVEKVSGSETNPGRW